jgi:AraC-like DNA-binding protein
LSLRAVENAVEHSVRLSLTEASLKQLLGSDLLPAEIEGVLRGPGIYSSSSFRLDDGISSTIDEIFDAVDADSTGSSLFAHGKAMELLALASDRLTSPSPSPSSLPVEHLRRLHEAREILLAQIDSIPSIPLLARRVRMGERQLKAGFKALFGAPIMAYARGVRMERARRLLADRRHNVTEVAHLMGYANPSKFAAAYRRQYGMSPSAA